MVELELGDEAWVEHDARVPAVVEDPLPQRCVDVVVTHRLVELEEAGAIDELGPNTCGCTAALPNRSNFDLQAYCTQVATGLSERTC